jgi:hypothetical protein
MRNIILVAYFHDIIHDSLLPSDSLVKNSFHLVNKISSQMIPEDSTLISLDIVSLFTNVPIELVINSLERCWDLI